LTFRSWAVLSAVARLLSWGGAGGPAEGGVGGPASGFGLLPPAINAPVPGGGRATGAGTLPAVWDIIRVD